MFFTRAELYSLIDELTLTPVPRRVFDGLAPNLPGGFGGALGSLAPVSISESAWFVEGAELPSPLGMIARPNVESQLTNASCNFRGCDTRWRQRAWQVDPVTRCCQGANP